MAFLGESDLSVNHKDGDKLNNNINNLEYLSLSDNVKHAYRTGLFSQVGSDNTMSKLTKEIVLKIRSMYNKKTCNTYQLAEIFNISQCHVSDIINKKRWSHV